MIPTGSSPCKRVHLCRLDLGKTSDVATTQLCRNGDKPLCRFHEIATNLMPADLNNLLRISPATPERNQKGCGRVTASHWHGLAPVELLLHAYRGSGKGWSDQSKDLNNSPHPPYPHPPYPHPKKTRQQPEFNTTNNLANNNKQNRSHGNSNGFTHATIIKP